MEFKSWWLLRRVPSTVVLTGWQPGAVGSRRRIPRPHVSRLGPPFLHCVLACAPLGNLASSEPFQYFVFIEKGLAVERAATWSLPTCVAPVSTSALSQVTQDSNDWSWRRPWITKEGAVHSAKTRRQEVHLKSTFSQVVAIKKKKKKIDAWKYKL